jgi:hypothetical protein
MAIPKTLAIEPKAKKLNILLLEPNYKNKYPPIGLMKISTYHKMQGHRVTFYKGDLQKLLIDVKVRTCLKALRRYNKANRLNSVKGYIEQYIKRKQLDTLESILNVFPKKHQKEIEHIIRVNAYSTPKNHWDRIYITTLFTFYWDITIKTIEFAKKLVVDKNNVLVGGVMASLLKEEIQQTTDIKPYTGLLNAPGMLDQGNQLIVDELPLDYSILGEIEYQYPTQSAYFTYMTKGCTRKCAFCSVPKLEPTYTPKVEAIDLFNQVKDRFGDQRNLMLMDNNVLASPMFPAIVQEIKQMGFTKDAVFYEPNQLDIAIKNLRQGINDDAYTKRALFLMHKLRRRLRGNTLVEYDNILTESGLLNVKTAEKKQLLKAYRKLETYYENFRWNQPMKRYVDFNQGVDARYVTEENMRLMSEIPIKPLRIAFDHIGIKSTYIKAVELAAKYGIKDLSNYILYNFQDKPADFYERLRINVDLGKRLGVTIFSFPMKYVPLFGEEAKDRKYVGKHWNKKYLRAIQCILNTTKGIVAPGYDFFQMSFGETFEQFMEILIMPEAYIVNRKFFEKNGMTQKWKEDFESMGFEEKQLAYKIILNNDFEDFTKHSSNTKILRLLSHYAMNSNRDKQFIDNGVKKLRKKFNSLIKRNMFVELTLTHDFENRKIAAGAA